jgi:hypothetical protein
MVRLILCVALALPVLAQNAPSFTCQRTNADPRYPTAKCAATNTGDNVPTWRLYGASEDMLMDFNEGFTFAFDVPTEWRLLEMRVETEQRRIGVRVWVRAWRGKVQWKRIGDEGSVE